MVPASLLWLSDLIMGVVESVKTEGGIVIKNVIPPDRARTLAKYVLDSELNERKDTDAAKKSVRGKGHRISAKGVGSISKFAPVLPELSVYLSDDRIVQAAETLLGINFRISTIGGLVNFPGNERGYWHSDWPFNQTVASNIPAPYPNIVMHLSSLIMLTEFSSSTGGTLIVPKSHLIPNNPSESDIYIDDSADLNIMELRAKARQLKADKDVDIIFIDYIQLLHAPQKSESRQQEISYISRSLKALAKELDIPIVALSQLSRAVESRTDHRPIMSDLRESGAIEQDADVVMFIYRKYVYSKAEEDQGMAEIIISKHRNGPTGTVKVSFIDKYAKFDNLDIVHSEYQIPS